jgi:CTP:molybdopterin cytidylyltransferase MocA
MNDKRGHPVLAARSMAAEFLDLPPDGQARDVVHRYRSQTLYVDVNDAGIFTDVDTRKAYEALKAHGR